MKRLALAAAVALACSITAVDAQSPASQHDARHAVMSFIGSQMRTLSNMAGNKDSYDPEYAAAATKAIAAIAKAFPYLFPLDAEADGLSQTEIAVLEGQDDFLAKITAFQQLADALASTRDAAAFSEAFVPFSGACRSCHSKYRHH